MLPNINCAYDEIVAIKKLKPSPRNPNRHSKEQIIRLAEILKYQGFRSPITVSNLSGYVVTGHGRLEASLLNGWDSVPIDYQDFPDEETEFAHMTADNAIASWAELDLKLIDSQLPDFDPSFNIELLGIKDFTLDFSEKEIKEKEPKKCLQCGTVVK